MALPRSQVRPCSRRCPHGRPPAAESSLQPTNRLPLRNYDGSQAVFTRSRLLGNREMSTSKSLPGALMFLGLPCYTPLEKLEGARAQYLDLREEENRGCVICCMKRAENAREGKILRGSPVLPHRKTR